jgi:hypothetical protein
MEARYVPGTWIAVVSGSVCLLIDAAPEAAVVRQCLNVARDGGNFDDMLAATLAEGLRAVADFVMAGWQDGGVRVLVRGRATVTVTPEGGTPETVGAAGVATWIDRRWPPPVLQIELRSTGGAGKGPHLGFWGGAALASGVTIEVVTTSSTGPTPEGRPQVRSGHLLASGGEAPPLDEVVLDTPPLDEVVVDTPPLDEVVVDAVVDQDLSNDQPSGTLAWQAHQPVDDGPEEVPAEDAPGFDHLFGATQRESPPSSEPGGASLAKVSVPLAAHDEPEPVSSEPVVTAQPTHAAPETGIISGLPWEAPHPEQAPARLVPETKAEGGSTSGGASGFSPDQAATVNRAQLLEQSLAGPTVLAVLCPAGHLSPAYASTCRVCQLHMASQQPFETPRPALGRLSFTTGDVVSLDRGVLMGRGPAVPDGTDADRPHVVQLGADGVDISREHLEVRLEGWHVQVCDLGSTNGTEVTLPGATPQRLHPHEPATIEPGTVVTLAEVASFTYEVVE